MNITRTAKFENGKIVYDPPFGPEEAEMDKLRFQSIVDSRQAPGTRWSDRAYMEGEVLNNGLGDHPREMAEAMVEQAKKAGINITGKVYKGGLADDRGAGDPRAWVGSADEALQVCRDRNLNITGGVEYQGHAVDREPDTPLSDTLVENIINDYTTKDPQLKRKPKQELREMVISKHGAPARGKTKRTFDDLAAQPCDL
jgi:hypothetical protein